MLGFTKVDPSLRVAFNDRQVSFLASVAVQHSQRQSFISTNLHVRFSITRFRVYILFQPSLSTRLAVEPVNRRTNERTKPSSTITRAWPRVNHGVSVCEGIHVRIVHVC